MRTLILALVGLSTLGELAALAAPPSLRRHHKHLAPIQHPSLRVRGGHAPPLEAGVDTELASKVLKTAMQKAFKGGVTGSIAGVAQVFSFMWLRTAMNYQYANGGNGTLSTVAALYEEGGLPRLYRGVQYALVQNPLSRFGDAAANAAVPALVLQLVPGIPLPASQAVASATAAGWRILIAPVDALKTALQVDGSATALTDRISTVGPGVLWRGSLAAAAATFVGNYPWFLTYNSLDQSLPPELYDGPAAALVRRALLGVCASCVSDVCSNAIRVVKTKVQTSPDEDTNPLQAARAILEEDGVEGLFLRGLETRLTINCLQGAVFSVAWKYFEKALAG